MKTDINEGIRAKEVRVIDEEGKQIGIMPLFAAIKLAKEKSLDLVEMSKDAVPPVCRIMDYGKFRYEQSKKLQEARKKQVVVHIKEVKFRPNTDEHDYRFKLKNIINFLKEGNKVKLAVTFKGRELVHTDLGIKVILRVIEDIKEFGIPEFPIKPDVKRTFSTVIVPVKAKKVQ
ncbi:MAG: translation initiation factor IF-3 [Deltaproteobacteria bacterium]|nr:translation initiation factor IF-3 [Deltaproteobacteria bacterium]MCL5880165.1 translation initiation factor IF-3 [Deltaproteobacteria bacterium]MDA8304785.1 translation initiation factor IF-3 [Deltaproteobacteria bacterium]